MRREEETGSRAEKALKARDAGGGGAGGAAVGGVYRPGGGAAAQAGKRLHPPLFLLLVKYERIKFLVIALKNSVEVYAWAPKPYHKFMAFKVTQASTSITGPRSGSSAHIP